MRQVFHDFIGTNNRLTSAYVTIIALSVGTFLIGFTITSLFARAVSTQNQSDYTTELTQDALGIKTQLSERLSSYNQLLYAASSQFATGDVSRADWQRVYSAMQVKDQYPSVMAIGYAAYVTTDGVSALQDSVRSEGYSDFTVQPAPISETSEHAVVQYIEPFEGSNLQAFGNDMYAENNQREAMNKARDTASTVLSRPVPLVRTGENSASLGSILYLPIYNTSTPPQSIADRRSHLKGYVYVAFQPLDIMARIVNQTPKLSDNVNVNLVSLSSGTGQTLFAANYSHALRKNQTITDKDVSLFGQTWRVEVAGQDQAINQFYGPLGLFFFGAGVSSFIALGVYFLLAFRIAKVEKGFIEDVENTKSELLALASHQLRTPATGVKQYLGILRDGIMGPLSPTQQEVVNKAFETNERQLHVINDLLYVSKVDTGQLVIDPVKTDVTEITRDVIANLRAKAEEKEIRVMFTVKRPTIITADDRYVAMIIENLISNAIKYSYRASTVRVTLKLSEKAMVLKVVDKGVGLAPDDVERAFSKFNRIDNPLSRLEGGSGLGLFLARQLAKGHGGTIEVEPSTRKGTTFVLTLPEVAMLDNEIVNLAHPSKRGKRLPFIGY